MTLSEITIRKTEAEDRHARVFATACNVILATAGGADLVTAWQVTYREMELLRKREAQLVGNGKLTDPTAQPLLNGAPRPSTIVQPPHPTLSEKRTESRSDASAPESATKTAPNADDAL